MEKNTIAIIMDKIHPKNILEKRKKDIDDYTYFPLKESEPPHY